MVSLPVSNHTVQRRLEVHQQNRVPFHARRHNRGFVADVGDVHPCEARHQFREAPAVLFHGGRQGQALQVHVEDFLAACEVGAVRGDWTVEATGPSESRVQDIDAVGAGEDHDVGAVAEAIHLHQHLVQGVLALVVAAYAAATALATNRIDLVDECRGLHLEQRTSRQTKHA